MKKLRHTTDPNIPNNVVAFAFKNGTKDPEGLLVLMDHVDPRVRYAAINFWGDVPLALLVKGLSDMDRINRSNAEHRVRELPFREDWRNHPHPFVRRAQYLAWVRQLQDPDKLRELAFGEAKTDDAILTAVLGNENTPLVVLRTLCGNHPNKDGGYDTVISPHLPWEEKRAIELERDRLNRPRRSGETGMWGQGE